MTVPRVKSKDRMQLTTKLSVLVPIEEFKEHIGIFEVDGTSGPRSKSTRQVTTAVKHRNSFIHQRWLFSEEKTLPHGAVRPGVYFGSSLFWDG